MSPEAAASEEELERLRAQLARAQREISQLRRVAETSEQLSLQSKHAMLRSNEELSRAKQLAEAVSDAKSRFLATMSHEIRTPMNGVIGCIDLLRTTELGEEQQQIGELLSGSADNLLSLINDVLDYAKVEAGKTVLERIPFRLIDCVEAVVAQEMPTAGKKGVRMRLEFSGDVPTHVVGDPIRLRQVLGNLVSNAVKFTPEGEVRVTVTQDVEAGPDAVLFAVRDTGIGLERNLLDSVFEPFRQADGGTTRLYGGTGLGLSICQGLVELMGGAIRVESEAGCGSCFSFHADLPEALAELDRRDRQESRVHRGFSHRVLLVDDTPINRVITGRMLERLGCTVDFATNGAEALELVRASRHDLILMDCSMPVMDGYEATRAIRAFDGDRSRTPIVALTAYAMAGDRTRCLEAGMDDYLSKPVAMDSLTETLVRYLGEP